MPLRIVPSFICIKQTHGHRVHFYAFLSQLLKCHDCISERSTRIAPPHRTERLEESEAITPLADGERPQRWG